MSTNIPFHRIKRVAVLGSGVMGSAIACHLAQCGAEVLLLDLRPFQPGSHVLLSCQHPQRQVLHALCNRQTQHTSGGFSDGIEGRGSVCARQCARARLRRLYGTFDCHARVEEVHESRIALRKEEHQEEDHERRK